MRAGDPEATPDHEDEEEHCKIEARRELTSDNLEDGERFSRSPALDLNALGLAGERGRVDDIAPLSNPITGT